MTMKDYRQNSNPLYYILATIIILIAILYIGIRAYSIYIFHDEALTYTYHATLSLSDIFNYRGAAPANNHLLNTLLIKLSTNIFGLSEFTVRLPALLGGIIYFIGTYKLLKLFLSKWHLLIGMLLMIFNPFLLELLSAGRGYSIALGFFLIGLYYIFIKIDGFEQDKSRYAAYSVIMMSGAVLSHLTFMYVYISSVIILVILQIVRVLKKQESLKKGVLYTFLPILLSMIVLTAIYYKPIMIMREKSESDIVANIGFWHDTVASLIESTLYGMKYKWDIMTTGKILIFVSIFSGVFIIIGELLKGRIKDLVENKFPWILCMLFICTFGIIMQHMVFNIPYVIGRYAIFYMPMFFLFILMLWKYILSFYHQRYIAKVTTAGICLLTLALTLHFINSANVQDSFIYKWDAYTREVLNEITERTKKYNLPSKTIRIGVSRTFFPSLDFYIKKNNLFWIIPYDGRDPYHIYDFYYILEDDKKKLEPFNMVKVIIRYNIGTNIDQAYYSYFGMLNRDAPVLRGRNP